MSIAFGIITSNNAFVASDGKVTNSLNEQLGFDKTFLIEHGKKKFIGAFTGFPMDFNGTKISDHLQDILSVTQTEDIDCVIGCLTNKLRSLIEAIPLTDVFPFEKRKVYVVLIGSRSWGVDDLEIYHIYFLPENGAIRATIEPTSNPRVIGSPDTAPKIYELITKVNGEINCDICKSIIASVCDNGDVTVDGSQFCKPLHK